MQTGKGKLANGLTRLKKKNNNKDNLAARRSEPIVFPYFYFKKLSALLSVAINARGSEHMNTCMQGTMWSYYMYALARSLTKRIWK